MAQKVPFIVAALGLDVDPFMLHLYAAFAELRRGGAQRHLRTDQGAACGMEDRGGPPWAWPIRLSFGISVGLVSVVIVLLQHDQ